MRLALFDLDHTLIAFDSGMAWSQFLIARGVLPAAAEAVYLAYCEAYVAGTLDIHAMHRANVAPLARFTVDEIAQWCAEFGDVIAARASPVMLERVARHRDAGDLCAIVTATPRFVAEPFARRFGISHLLATEPARTGGRYSGEIEGEPCFRAHKISHVQRWLAASGRSVASFDASFFYSDSASDLPLLEAVTDPVAVRPDERLRQHAEAAGWPTLDLE